MHPQRPTPPDSRRMIRVRGKLRPYLERLRIGRREYYLLESVGNGLRSRFRAFDPDHGPDGDYFLVEHIPAGPEAERALRVLHKLKCDSLPRVWDWRQTAQGIDAVLSWITGVDLESYLENIRTKEKRPGVAAGEAVRLIHGLAGAVGLLTHSLQMAHGDIHPANLVLTNNPSRLVLIDFGSAVVHQAAATATAGDGRRHCYAAPELRTPCKSHDAIESGSDTERSARVGFLSDQFSASVVLYQLLTLSLPYGGLGGKAGWEEFKRAGDDLIPPSQMLPNRKKLPRSLRDELDEVVLRGLALDSQQRYPDRHAWLDALFRLSARFRVPPELPPTESFLTRVIARFVNPRRSGG